MKKLALHAMMFLALSLSAPSAFASDNSFWGTGIGAALGGLTGAQIGKGDGQLAATGAGVFLGGLIGNSVGHSMDRASAPYYSRGYSSPMMQYEQPYSSYEPTYVAPPPQVVFAQPEDVEYYAPRRSVYVEEGYLGPPPPTPAPSRHARHCREFTQKINIEGQIRESYGTACLRPDGSWQIER